ncbi:MAG TPA: ATPase, T2SS/T4P/T4SS family, partial [Caldimonas sp.]|nr:ATPase, T2SS/T4P/T4SS family [Caldimonas sp.]
MADLSQPLSWDTPEHPPARLARARREREGERGGKDKAAREVFRWPTPPFASYPAASEQTETLPCQVMTPDGRMQHGRLTFFVPDTAVAHVQMPPARTTVPLRFDEFTALVLTTPLEPLPLPLADPHADLLRQRTVSSYRVALVNGGRLKGETVGHVELDIGLFLFPPYGDGGAVQRMFVPRAAYESCEVGPRIGEVLVEQHAATQEQVDRAVDEQRHLRQQKIGDILLMKHIVSADQLLEAIERQQKMPLVRIGEALLSLGMVREDQIKEALVQQALDRSVPLGEVLVRMGVVSREDLQIALARKMGYPLVDVERFPAEPEALRRLSYAVASRLRVIPLLVREGRLVVGLEDPSRRAALEEIEFTADMKVVPVLARSRSIDATLHAAYEKIGAGGAAKAGSEDLGQPIAYEPEPAKASDMLVETLEKEDAAADRPVPSADDKPVEQSDNSLVRLINSIVVEAHRDGVSDIHIESYPGREKIRVRFRKDGVLRTYIELPANYRSALIARIKIMCDLDISERRKPQDGKINFAKFSPQHKLELRVATIPTNNG